MFKLAAYISILIVAAVLIACQVARSGSGNFVQEKPVKNQLIVYQAGKAGSLDDRSRSFAEIVAESQRLFEESDSSPRLIMSAERIERIKKTQDALELILPETRVVTLKNQQPVHYTRLLIPLSGEFANGTVFFGGAYERNLQGKKAEYSALTEYGSTNFVRNTRGLDKLKELLQNSGIAVN